MAKYKIQYTVDHAYDDNNDGYSYVIECNGEPRLSGFLYSDKLRDDNLISALCFEDYIKNLVE